MKLSDIKVIKKGGKKQVFIDGVEQNNVAKVETEVLQGEITVVKISYYTDKFEVIRVNEDIERINKNIDKLLKEKGDCVR